MCDEIRASNDQEDFVETIKNMEPTQKVHEHKPHGGFHRRVEVKDFDREAKAEEVVNNSFRFSLLYKSVTALIKIVPSVLQASEKIKLAMKKGFRRKTRPV
ncbi:unnamed protein product [Hymenolepis diminuta]|uniref:Uncharacterized protein n=1 Tax=Hymenolepis diminuta TaxID=6216 RepID=A0A564YE26_HYMDI|nr:unnamed protein product [Hymenolepis diminuta]